MMAQQITPADAKKARDAFQANEPRDLFYRAATELVDLALRRATSITVAEALAVLLQTWNKAYYQYRKFDNAHFTSIEKLLTTHQTAVKGYDLGENGRTAEWYRANNRTLWVADK